MFRKLSVSLVALSALGLGLGLPGAAVAQDQTFAVANDSGHDVNHTIPPGGTFNVDADCTDPNQGGQANAYATGGGCEFTTFGGGTVLSAFYASFPFFRSFPVIAGWQCIGKNTSSSNGIMRAWAVCQNQHRF